MKVLPLPLLSRIRQAPVLSTVGVCALLLACITGVRAGLRRPEPPPNRPIEVRADGYVSSNACQACHPGQHATWRASYHRRMTQVANAETILADWRSELELNGETHRLFREGEAHFIETRGRVRPGPDGGAVPARRRVVLTTGSHHFQAYWLETEFGRRVELFPLVWQLPEGRWLAFDDLMLAPPDLRQVSGAGGEWNTTCLNCHSTAPRSKLVGAHAIDTYAAELGIACEACHGPGQEHVRANHGPWRRYWLRFRGQGDPTIVNPARLDALRSAQVCGQCHSHFAKEAAGEDGSLHATPYRPGEDLWAERVQVIGDRPTPFGRDCFWDDGRVRGNGREYAAMLRSRCFASGKLTCTTCHAMHGEPGDARDLASWANDQLRPGADGDRSCLDCHEELARAAPLVAHTHHRADSVGSRCMNCHMPYQNFGLHKATRTHEISVPTVAESVELGRPNGCNACHLDRSLGWTAERLKQWYGTPIPEIPAPWRQTAASVVWTLSGDAHQRALMAFAYGWAPARLASGEDWIAPYLAQLLVDPYTATRSAALRSLQTLEGFRGFAFDVSAPFEERNASGFRVVDAWRTSGGTRQTRPEVLVGPGPAVRAETYEALLAGRDHRRVMIPD
jgi:nitrate/TMAO reductase-like tetraheme cytochrome c subunit